jgi:putative addiction module component (TIGR02574 family)
MSAKQTVILDVLRLSESDRLDIAEAIYESLEGPANPGAAAAWDEEIRRRMEKVRSGSGVFVPWQEARRRIAGEGDGSAAR